MPRTGAVQIGKESIYAFYEADDEAASVRMSGEECGRLDLFEGKQLRIVLPGQGPTRALLTRLRSAPPFIWVEMEKLADVGVPKLPAAV